MLKEKLKKITENAMRRVHDDDVIALGDKLLQNFECKCIDAANDEKKEIEIFLFNSKTTFNDRLIYNMLDKLIKYIQEKTELNVSVQHFLLENGRSITIYDELCFNDSEEFTHFYLIKLGWL